jgi:hypothetical protein
MAITFTKNIVPALFGISLFFSGAVALPHVPDPDINPPTNAPVVKFPKAAPAVNVPKSALATRFPYGSTKVRGVNLGGWLVLEVSSLLKCAMQGR